MRQNKYMARRVNVAGEQFDSKREARRYLELIKLVDTGVIKNLCRQVPFELIPEQREPSTEVYSKGANKGKPKPGRLIEKKCVYIADFVYTCNGKTVVEDVKGYKGGGAYAVFTIKRKLMLFRYGIRIKEVK